MSLPISRAEQDRLESIPGVGSVGLGLDDEGNEAIILNVTDEEAARRADEQAPLDVEGFPVLIEIHGTRRRLSAGAIGGPEAGVLPVAESARTQRRRPVPGGVSVGHVDVTAGTTAWLLVDDDGAIFPMSNQHVIAPDEDVDTPAAEGDEIIQPGGFDGGSSPDDVIGHLAWWSPPTGVGDMAYMEPVDESEFTIEIEGIGEPRGVPRDVYPGDIVAKSGRSSGVSFGEVQQVNVSTEEYSDQIIVNPIFEPGDSGSPVTIQSEDGHHYPVGIGWGNHVNDDGEVTSSLVTPASNIEEATGLTILTADTGDSPPEPPADAVQLSIGSPFDVEERIDYSFSVSGGEIVPGENVDLEDDLLGGGTRVDGYVFHGDADYWYYTGCVDSFEWDGPSEPIVRRDGSFVGVEAAIDCSDGSNGGGGIGDDLVHPHACQIEVESGPPGGVAEVDVWVDNDADADVTVDLEIEVEGHGTQPAGEFLVPAKAIEGPFTIVYDLPPEPGEYEVFVWSTIVGETSVSRQCATCGPSTTFAQTDLSCGTVVVEDPNPDPCADVTCPEGEKCVDGACEPICSDPFVYDPGTGECLPPECGEGMEWDPGVEECVPIDDGPGPDPDPDPEPDPGEFPWTWVGGGALLLVFFLGYPDPDDVREFIRNDK